MSEHEKKRQRIYYLLNAETEPNFFVYCIQSKEKILEKKNFLMKRGYEGLNKKRKDFLLLSVRQLRRTTQS